MFRQGVTVLTLLCALTTSAENWPQFRGPRGDGTSAEPNPPTQWSQTNNVAWKTPLPGEGHSSPIIWNNDIFLTSALENGDRVLMNLDATSGKITWQTVVATSEKEAMHRENSSASSTPATDGQSVVTSFQVGDKVDIRSYNFEGNLQWSSQPLKFSGEHGYSYSPIFYKDLVILDCRQEGDAATIAFDKKSGAIRWKTEPKRQRISHITPLLINDGREQLLLSGSDETASHDPATGKQLWWCKGPSDVSVAGMSFSSPDRLIFVTAGYPARTRMAIRTDGSGDVTDSKIAWKTQRQVTYVPSPVYHNGNFYSVLDEGMMCCFDAKTGETKWEERLGGRYRTSLLLADGLIFATNDKGVTTIFRASPEGFQQVARNELNESSYATHALSNGRLFIRTDKNLYAIGKPQAL